MRLYFDTETTNYYEFQKSWDHPSQPACAQIAAVLESESGKTVAAISALLAPQWPRRETAPVIDEKITKLCGITNEDVEMYGQSPQLIWNQLWQMITAARVLVAHNEEFDVKILRRFAMDLGMPDPLPSLPPRYCTMRSSAKLVGLPGNKHPKLAEAYYWATGRVMSGAHDALNDVYACRQVYRGIQRAQSTSSAS